MNSRVAIVRCFEYSQPVLLEKLTEAIGLLGGITAFVRPKSKVLLKPNLLMPKNPDCGITTHPELVRSVVRLLKGIDCQIFIGDAPSIFGGHWKDVDRVYEVTGIKRVAEEEGVRLVFFDKRRWRNKFPLTTWLDECDYLINLPKFKTHNLTLLTAAVKNLFGLIPGTFKSELHKNYFDTIEFSSMLVDLYQEARPSLNIVDGILAIEGDGPATAGKLRKTNFLLVSDDAVAVDSILARIMGIEPELVPTNKEAARRGLGKMQIKDIELFGDSLVDVVKEPFELPVTSLKVKLANPLMKVFKGFLRFYPQVRIKECSFCQSCVRACPTNAVFLRNNKIIFNYSRCIGCFCCQEVCPSSAIKTQRTILAKIIFR